MSEAVVLKPQSGTTWGSLKTTDAWFRSQTFELCRERPGYHILTVRHTTVICSKV